MKEVALVLGGGGARGLAHIHVLEAFDDLGVRPCVIAGSSIGSLMGAAYAAGMSGAQIHEYVLATLDDRTQVMARLWRMWPESLTSMFGGSALRFGELDAERILRAFLPETLPDRFEDLAIPLKVTATDFYSNALTMIEKGELYPALAASIALPAVFRPQLVNGRVHIDGGIASPVPFSLVEAPERIVVAVDVVGMPAGKNPAEMPSRIEAAFGTSQLLMQSVIKLELKVHKPDLFVRPQVDGIRVLDFLHARKIIAQTEPTRAEVRTELERILAGR